MLSMIFKLLQMTNGKIQIELTRYTGTNKTKNKRTTVVWGINIKSTRESKSKITAVFQYSLLSYKYRDTNLLYLLVRTGVATITPALTIKE